MIDEAHALNVSPDFVRALMECYGTPGPRRIDPIKSATLGIWGSSPEGVVRMYHDMLTPRPLGDLYTVATYTTSDGQIHYTRHEAPSTISSVCANAMYQGGRTQKWMAAPLKGTAHRLRDDGLEEIGIEVAKTGTPCARDPERAGAVCRGYGKGKDDKGGENNAAWVVAGRKTKDGHTQVLIAGYAADDPKDYIGPPGVTSTTVATPMGAIIVSALDSF